MKTDVKLLEIKGIKTPDFAEPKGEKFRQAMKEIHVKVEEKRVIRNESVSTIERLKSDLAILKGKQIMAEDKHEEMEFKKKRKEVQEQLDNTEDYSGLDVDAYAKKLINNPEIKKLEEDARLECIAISQIANAYEKELRNNYETSRKEVARYTAGERSDSEYRQAAINYNRYKNN
jgi:hypothetical protein